MELVYYTVGFNAKYINLVYVSIQSVRKYNNTDIMVICDESLVETCKQTLSCFSNIIVVPCKDSISGMDSSMKKLLIFDYDLSKYSKVLFVDADILVDVNLSVFFNKFTENNKLYAYTENSHIWFHTQIHFSLLKYFC